MQRVAVAEVGTEIGMRNGDGEITRMGTVGMRWRATDGEFTGC